MPAKLATICSTGHVWLGVKVDGWGRGGERRIDNPLLHFDRRSPPLVQKSFSSQLNAAVKIKDGSYNFHQGNTEDSPTKITSTLQARWIREANVMLYMSKSTLVEKYVYCCSYSERKWPRGDIYITSDAMGANSIARCTLSFNSKIKTTDQCK